MHRSLAIFAFYKSFIPWSLVANTIVVLINPDIIPGLITKVFLTVFAWYYIHETVQRRKLTFYKNIGISPLKLFTITFFIDATFTVIFIIIFKEFT